MRIIKNILLTGATGFIGSHLLEELLKNKYRVLILKRSHSNTSRIDRLLRQVKVYNTDKVAIQKMFTENKIEAVVHVATFYVKQHKNLGEIRETIDANISFPTELLELAKEFKVPYFINTGTFFEYKLDKKIKLTENSKICPYNFYAASKVSFENILQYYCDNYPIKGITLKLFAPYGEKDNNKLVIFLMNSLFGKNEIAMTRGEQKWNFTYVKDIVDAYMKSLKYIPQMKENYQDFNIGTDKTISIKELANTLERISNKKLNIEWGAKEYSKKEIFYANCDNKKARKFLNWEPKYNINSGIKSTYHYYDLN